MSENIFWHKGKLGRKDRNKLLKFKNKVLWFTGLSGSGKSTIAFALEKALHGRGILTYVLDGDNVRHGLNSNLGFSESDRNENIRRVGEVSKLFYDSGIMVLVSFISPYRKDRQRVRELIGEDFVEVFVDCPIEECMRRDPKGLYKKAKSGEITDMTGVDSPYEKSKSPEVVVNTAESNVDECVEKILSFLKL